MVLRFSYIFVLLIAAGLLLFGCKNSTTDPNGNNNNTNTNIGDSIPRQHSHYSYLRYQLDMHDSLIAGNIAIGDAFIDTIGISIFGKTNVFFIFDEDANSGTSVDTSYYSYEANSDVSVYLENPGFLKNNGNGEQIDETLQTITNLVFHNWITLPIASKTTLYPYDAQKIIEINGSHDTANIHTVVEFIGDSSITTTKGKPPIPENLLSKHCRISITAKIILGTDPYTMTHVRDIWFVPKIGYIARQMTRTFVPAYPILVVPIDTTATLKVMTNYTLF